MNFTIEQANAYRLKKQYLLHNASGVEEIVQSFFGIQSQVYSATVFNINSRLVSKERFNVDELIEKRKLIKSWGMRGTLHLFSPKDLLLYHRVKSHRSREWELKYAKYHKMSVDEYEKAREIVLRAIEEEPHTKTEIVEILEKNQEGLSKKCISGWGGILQILSLKGLICFGPDKNKKSTFTAISSWIGDVKCDYKDPELEFLKRYLIMYAPSTVRDFAYWAGMKITSAREIWKRLEKEIISVNTDGLEGYILKEDLPELTNNPEDNMCILSYFDNYLLGHKFRDYFIERDMYKRVSRTSGWIYPVILHNGRIIGVWTSKKYANRIEVSVDLFNGNRVKRILRKKFREFESYFDKEINVNFNN